MPSKNNLTFHNKPCNIKIHQVQKLKMLFYLHLKSCTESSMDQRQLCFIKWHIFANWALLQPFLLQSFAHGNLFWRTRSKLHRCCHQHPLVTYSYVVNRLLTSSWAHWISTRSKCWVEYWCSWDHTSIRDPNCSAISN